MRTVGLDHSFKRPVGFGSASTFGRVFNWSHAARYSRSSFISAGFRRAKAIVVRMQSYMAEPDVPAMQNTQSANLASCAPSPLSDNVSETAKQPLLRCKKRTAKTQERGRVQRQVHSFAADLPGRCHAIPAALKRPVVGPIQGEACATQAFAIHPTAEAEAVTATLVPAVPAAVNTSRITTDQLRPSLIGGLPVSVTICLSLFSALTVPTPRASATSLKERL